MKQEQDGLARVPGPEDALQRLRSVLDPSWQLRASEAGDAVEIVSDGAVTLRLAEHRRVAGVARRHAPPAAPIVALGCPDVRAVQRALAAGARLALREDAANEEIRSVVTECVAREEATREAEAASADLLRQSSLVMKDDLTAAYNRRFFERFLDEEIDRSRRFGKHVSLIFMDLDDLKEINKRFGHAMGSLVLQEAAARTIRTIRSIDKVVRYGGDEFCIVLPETEVEGAREVAERIRSSFVDDPFAVRQTGGVTLTASFGIASFPDHAAGKADLVKIADRAMQRMKDARKNGILVGEEEP